MKKTKENQRHTSGPVKKSNSWKKADWVKYGEERGVKNAKELSVHKIRAELKRLKEQGLIEDGRKNNGGHENVGKKNLTFSEKVQEIREAHLEEEVEVIIHNKQTNEYKVEKKKTMRAILDMLRNEAIAKKSIPAAKEYFDRAIGRAQQEIKHTGEIKVEEQRLPTKAEQAAALAYLKAIKEGGYDD